MTKRTRHTRRRAYFPRFRRHNHKPKSIPLSMLPSILVPIGTILGGNSNGGAGEQHGGLIRAFQTGDMAHIAEEVKNIVPYETIGYSWDGHWDWKIIARNIGLIVGGAMVHKLAQKTGANNYVQRIPFVGKYLSV